MIHDWFAGWPIPVFILGAQQVVIGFAAFLHWRGFPKPASQLLAFTILSSAGIFVALSAQGLHNSATLMFPMSIVLAALLFETSSYVLFSLAVFLTVVALAGLEEARILPLDSWADDQAWLDVLVILTVTATIAGLLVRRLRASLGRSQAYGESLRALAAATAGPSGIYFSTICTELRKILGFGAVFILELPNPDSDNMLLQGGDNSGELVSPGRTVQIDVVLAETLHREAWHVAELPAPWASQLLGADTNTNWSRYFGAPLRGPSGPVLGTVVGLSPVDPPLDDLQLTLLSVYLAGVSSELEIRRADRVLLERTRERDSEHARNQQMLQTLQALTGRMEDVRERERTRIAREIHDELGQQLTAMRFELATLGRHIKEIGPLNQLRESGSPVAPLTAMVDQTIQSVRRIATELRPGILDTFGVGAAIEWLVNDFQQRTGIATSYDGPDDLVTPDGVSTALFRICQEAITNAARHSGASEVSVHLANQGDSVTLVIADDGCGFDWPSGHDISLGLIGMRERARMSGGRLTIQAQPGNGVVITATLPLALRLATKEAHA